MCLQGREGLSREQDIGGGPTGKGRGQHWAPSVGPLWSAEELVRSPRMATGPALRRGMSCSELTCGQVMGRGVVGWELRE